MSTKKGGKSRGDITDHLSRSKRDLDERGIAMEVVADDHDVVETTLSSLDFGGTSDASNAVEENMRSAREVTDAIFEEKDRDLERAHQDAEGFSRELNDGASRDASDLDKVNRASSSVRTQETSSELQRAQSNVREDMEFLQQRMATIDENTAASDRTREALRARIKGRNHD